MKPKRCMECDFVNHNIGDWQCLYTREIVDPDVRHQNCPLMEETENVEVDKEIV